MARLALLALVACLALALPALDPPDAAAASGISCRAELERPKPRAMRLSRCPIRESPRWREYVLDDEDGLVYPARVLVENDEARVSNPEGLMAPGGGVTEIRAAGRGRPRLVLDLGLNTGGHVEVGIARGDGTPVRLAYSERRQYLDDDGDWNGENLGYHDDPDARVDLVPTGDAPLEVRSQGGRGGQRWVLLQLEGPGAVAIDYVRVRTNHYRPSPDDYVGRFLSSDDVVNRAWWASAYTFNLVSARDEERGGNLVVMDGAKRDRLVWIGDLGIQGPVGYYSTRRATEIVRDSLYLFACQQEATGYIPMTSQIGETCPADPGPPDGPREDPETSPLLQIGKLGAYTAWWVIAVAEYYEHTGDEDFTRRLLPAMRRALQFFEDHSPRGLYLTGRFLPPTEINWHPFDVPFGEDAHTNALVHRAALDLARLERRIGAGESASRRYERQAELVRSALIELLYDERVGAFRLNTLNPLPNHTQDANVEAVRAGVIGGQRAERALRFVRTRLASRFGTLTGEFDSDPYMDRIISPFISSEELLTRFERGEGAEAMDLLRRLWGHMVSSDPETTVWEKVAPSGDPAPYNVSIAVDPQQRGPSEGFTSLAHGWSAGPVPALSGYVLGMRPVEPGWGSWIVEPQPVDLRSAQGQVGTPHGTLVSRWARGAGDRWFRLTVRGPRAATGTVAIPLLGADRTIAIDGRVAWRRGRPARGVDAIRRGAYVEVRGVRGSHTFAWGRR